MPQSLLLRLPAPGQEETEWLTLDESGAPTLTRQRGPLSLAAAVGRTGKVIVLAPASQILLAEPELPPGTGAKIARAVPFALEEQLTEDVDQLCFAIGRRRAGGGTPVAVVSRSVLQTWIANLSAAGIEPHAIYPDISLMPENPGQTVLWLEKQRLAVRRPGALPFAVELSPVKEALVVAGVIADPLDSSAESKTPESAILYVTREDWARVQGEFEQLVQDFASLKVQLLADGAAALAGARTSSRRCGQLAAGRILPSRRLQRKLAPMAGGGDSRRGAARRARRRSGVCRFARAKHESAALDSEISQVFATAMPTDRITDPRRQMQDRLDRIRKSGAGPQYFLRALQTLSAALASTPKTTINSLSYRDQSMEMTVNAPSLAALSQLSQLVAKEGLAAEIQSSNPVASRS